MALRDFVIAAEQIGLTDVILPFILVFTIVFAVLQKTRVLGVYPGDRPKANINAMIAVVIAFFVLIMVRTLKVITLFTQYATIILVAFIFLGILFALLGVRERHKNLLMFLALMLLAFVFLQALAWTGAADPGMINQFWMPILVVIAVIGIVGFWLKGRPPAPKKRPEEKKKQEEEELPGFEKAGVVRRRPKTEEEEA
jgi:peptidoglycan/LPS O-acetylase OafA/YrhL